MNYDALDGMLAALPKSFENFEKDFTVERKEKFYSYVKLANDDESLTEELSIPSIHMHYKHCIP